MRFCINVDYAIITLAIVTTLMALTFVGILICDIIKTLLELL